MKDAEASCPCGAITLRILGGFDDDAKAGICHCTDCQKATGSLFAYFTAVPVERLHIVRGQPKTFRALTPTMSGKPMNRIFCGDCGTPLAALAEGVPERYCILLAIFENSLEPGMEIFWRSSKKWEKPMVTQECLHQLSPFV